MLVPDGLFSIQLIIFQSATPPVSYIEDSNHPADLNWETMVVIGSSNVLEEFCGLYYQR
jgi:hypothetical protein